MRHEAWPLLIVMALSGCAGNAGDTNAASPTPPVAVAPAPAPSQAAFVAPAVTPQQAYARMQAGEEIVFVDVRAASAYERSHIEGAVSHPWTSNPRFGRDLPKDKLLLLYCT